MKPCQDGYKCDYGNHQQNCVVCSLPRCVLKRMTGKSEGMLFDELRKKVVRPKRHK